jgi:hypothetical protein
MRGGRTGQGVTGVSGLLAGVSVLGIAGLSMLVPAAYTICRPPVDGG